MGLKKDQLQDRTITLNYIEREVLRWALYYANSEKLAMIDRLKQEPITKNIEDMIAHYESERTILQRIYNRVYLPDKNKE